MKTSPPTAPMNSCLRYFLTAMSPLQTVLDRPGLTHELCIRQGLAILGNDGLSHHADFFRQYRTELILGVYWADKGWKNIHHYFDPGAGKGLWQFANAITTFEFYYRLALAAGRSRDLAKAAFLLGAAAHLMQDLCVPQHARAKLFDGHKHFEGWVQERRDRYAVAAGGVYHEGRPVTSLLLANACTAADYFDWVKTEGDESRFHQATGPLLALAQRTTSGLLWHFADDVSKELATPLTAIIPGARAVA